MKEKDMTKDQWKQRIMQSFVGMMPGAMIDNGYWGEMLKNLYHEEREVFESAKAELIEEGLLSDKPLKSVSPLGSLLHGLWLTEDGYESNWLC